ncbi:MAG TPA: putative nucleotidyltransferase substrate binding domain-containing protein [Actinomycetota bacterium]
MAGATRLESYASGTTILQQGGEPAEALFVVRSGAVELLDDGVAIDLLEEGEAFGHPSLVAGVAPMLSVRAVEDTECLLVDRAVADRILRTPIGMSFLARAIVRRSQQASLALDAIRVSRPAVSVRTLIRRRPVSCDPGTTAQEAARTMAAEHVSSILVVEGRPIGIVTDRDLRSKVLAGGRDMQVPVHDVMSSPLVTVSGDTTSEEALLVMLERGFHHLPVLGTEGTLLGVVSDTDLMAVERSGPFALLRSLDRATSADEVAEAMAELPGVVRTIVEAELDPVDAGQVIAGAIDAATRRLIHLAISELGEPPGSWAWVALGSEARREQSLRTDQDHALVFRAPDVPLDEADGYFGALAERVTDGLAGAGVPRCRGGVMASSRAWRGDRDTWIERYRTQLAATDTDSTVFSNIALDHRRVAGSLDIEPAIDGLVRAAAREGWLVRRLALAAVAFRPPTGFFRDFVVEHSGSRAGTLDVKHGGITPITNLARTFAVGSGSSSTTTIERLRGATAAGAVDRDLGEGLEEAFRLLWRVRLHHQVEQLSEGVAPDDDVDPGSLGPLTRRGLKEAFRLILRGQRHLATTLGLRVR